ncbi:MAG: hypothetical protein WHV44_10425 [Anaerolineales bacterium]
MDADPSPTISSFVIRFVISSAPADGTPPYRGAIRHIQTEEEMNFNSWEDAVAFIRRFVPLETEQGQ